jgi:hypothetical protein
MPVKFKNGLEARTLRVSDIAVVGQVLTATNTSGNAIWQTPVRRETHTWAIGGDIKIAAADVDFIPPMFTSKLAGETLTLLSVRTRINSGTSATIKIVRKTSGGASADIATAISATTASTTSAAINTVIGNLDELRPEVTAVSGTPKNLTITAVFERAS